MWKAVTLFHQFQHRCGKSFSCPHLSTHIATQMGSSASLTKGQTVFAIAASPIRDWRLSLEPINGSPRGTPQNTGSSDAANGAAGPNGDVQAVQPASGESGDVLTQVWMCCTKEGGESIETVAPQKYWLPRWMSKRQRCCHRVVRI